MASALVGDNLARLPAELLILALMGVVTAGAFIGKYQEQIETALMRWIKRIASATATGATRMARQARAFGVTRSTVPPQAAPGRTRPPSCRRAEQ